MIKNQWGRIIAIGSVCGIETRKDDRPWFAAAKAAQHAIIKSFSKKHNFTKKNITFNTISPGTIFIKDTGWYEEKKKNPKKFKKYVDEFVPTKNLGEPEISLEELKVTDTQSIIETDLFANIFNINRYWFSEVVPHEENFKNKKFYEDVGKFFDNNLKGADKESKTYSFLNRYYVFQKME
jgi:NAD(P)-dependent dehydrogenase (short-subunit alcohol dehydrogenase family)